MTRKVKRHDIPPITQYYNLLAMPTLRNRTSPFSSQISVT